MNPKNTRNTSSNVLVLVCLAWTTAASALPLTEEEFGRTHSLRPGEPTGTINGYDSVFEDTYINTNRLTMVLAEHDPFTLLANDVQATTILNARVDASGTLIGGTFAVIGSSADLGIATGTALLTATVTDALFDSDGTILSAGEFQFRARVDFLSPALRAIIGPVKSVLIGDLTSDFPGGPFYTNPWNATYFGGGGPDAGPWIDLSPNALPLTPVEALTTHAATNTSAPVSGYDAATDTYTIDSTLNLFPLASYPGFGSLVGDIQATFEFSAVVDNTGTLTGGSMLWVGGSASLAIPAGSTLIAGTPVEAHFVASTGILFQFLVMVDAVHPALEAVTGPLQTVVVYDYQAPGGDFAGAPWEESFFDAAYTTGPDLFLSPETMMNSDTDGDGIADVADNCTTLSNGSQRDTDGDGIGNRCDTDLSQDCMVNATDLGLFRSVFFSQDPTADFDGNGAVNAVDLGILRAQFFRNFALNNPSSTPNLCN